MRHSEKEKENNVSNLGLCFTFCCFLCTITWGISQGFLGGFFQETKVQSKEMRCLVNEELLPQLWSQDSKQS